MHKRIYKKPEIEVLKVRVEKGFALSFKEKPTEVDMDRTKYHYFGGSKINDYFNQN